jgi:hypothetical protein
MSAIRAADSALGIVRIAEDARAPGESFIVKRRM